MKFLKDRIFWLMFVLFFLTVFFHGCSSGGPKGMPELDFSIGAIGFPFAYLFPQGGLEISFLWWALILNILFFTFIYAKRKIIFHNQFIKRYSAYLAIIHIVMSFVYYFLFIMQIPYEISFFRDNPLPFLIAYIILLIGLVSAYFFRKRILQNPKYEGSKMRIKYTCLGTVLLFSIPLVSLIISPLLLIYIIIAVYLGDRVLLFIPYLGYGVKLFIILWIAGFIFSLMKKKSGKTANKPPLKKKSS